MTDTTTTPDTPDTAPEAPETAPSIPQGDEQATGDQHTEVANPAAHAAAREAAKHRVKLREAEERSAALEQRVTAMQRAEVERIAGTKLTAAEDFWTLAPDLPELLDEAGELDHDRITDAIADVIKQRPHWRKPARVTENSSIVTSADIVDARDEFTFTDAFRPR